MIIPIAKENSRASYFYFLLLFITSTYKCRHFAALETSAIHTHTAGCIVIVEFLLFLTSALRIAGEAVFRHFLIWRAEMEVLGGKKPLRANSPRVSEGVCAKAVEAEIDQNFERKCYACV